MKKSILNAIAAMLTVLMFVAPVTALTEGEESAPVVEVKQEVKEQKSEEKAETKAEEKAETKSEEKAETKTEEKVEEKAEEKVEEKVEEKAAEQAETAEQTKVESEDKVEATEEAPAEEAEAEDEAEIEDYETPLGSSDEEDLTISVKEAFKGSVRVELKENLPIYYGDEVTMQAIVTRANMSYKVLWQTFDVANGEWKTIHTGDEYAITVTEENADVKYHVVLEVKDEACVTASYRLPEAAERPIEVESVNEDPAEEEIFAEESAEEAPAEEPAIEAPADEQPAAEESAEEAPAARKTSAAAEKHEREEQPVVVDAGLDDESVATNADASVRLDADGMSEIFATLPEGTEIKVLGIDGDWAMVEIDGQIGYIYKDEIDGIDFEALQPEVPADEEQDPEANMKVTIFTSRRTAMKVGETVYLTSKLEGFEDYEVAFRWECDKGEGFEAVEGGDTDSYTYEASVESLSWNWRLTVLYR